MKTVVLISGKLRSGKNTLSSIMREQLETRGLTVREDFFAKDLKNGATTDFKPLQKLINNEVEEIISSLPSNRENSSAIEQLKKLKWNDENYLEEKTAITRCLLQTYGTEIFRERVNDNHWVDQVIGRINKTKSDFFLITDVRFPNEIDRVIEKGGEYKVVTVRVERDDIIANAANTQHPSETGLDHYESWDFLVDNNSGIYELTCKGNELVHDILSGENSYELEPKEGCSLWELENTIKC